MSISSLNGSAGTFPAPRSNSGTIDSSSGRLSELSVNLPRQIAQALTEFLKARHTGKVTLHVKQGKPASIDMSRTVHVD